MIGESTCISCRFYNVDTRECVITGGGTDNPHIENDCFDYKSNGLAELKHLRMCLAVLMTNKQNDEPLSKQDRGAWAYQAYEIVRKLIEIRERGKT